jgi:hypothetical protein
MAGPAFVDDPTIADDASLWRRIHPAWAVPDEYRGGWRVSSAAFDDSRDGSPLSVLLAAAVAATGRGPANILARHEGYSLASFTVGTARACGQGVARTPTPDEPAHASVFGPKTSRVKRNLANAARWVIGPPA